MKVRFYLALGLVLLTGAVQAAPPGLSGMTAVYTLDGKEVLRLETAGDSYLRVSVPGTPEREQYLVLRPEGAFMVEITPNRVRASNLRWVAGSMQSFTLNGAPLPIPPRPAGAALTVLPQRLTGVAAGVPGRFYLVREAGTGIGQSMRLLASQSPKAQPLIRAWNRLFQFLMDREVSRVRRPTPVEQLMFELARLGPKIGVVLMVDGRMALSEYRFTRPIARRFWVPGLERWRVGATPEKWARP